MQRPIKYYGDPILRQKGSLVTDFNSELKLLVQDMVETMYAEAGIGLAAQQIGIDQQICVVDVRPPKETDILFNYTYDGKTIPLDLFMPMALINPSVTITDDSQEVYEEGCLSFPRITGNVHRPIAISCQFQDVHGNPHTVTADGLLARCILHEIDHLNGVLFIDKMDQRDLRKHSTRIKQLKRSHKA